MQKLSEKIVKVNLIKTSLQTVQNKSLVIPESKGKYDIEKIVELMKPQVPFVDKSILAILIRTFNQKVIELASEGYHIDTELVHIRPVITGTVAYGKTTLKGNKLKVVSIPGKALRNSVSKTKLRVSRKFYENRCIWDAINPVNQKEPFTEKGMVKVFGRNLKVMGNFPECGVWLEGKDTGLKFQISGNRIFHNKPKTLMFHLPDELPAGTYYISVVTCYCGTKRLLTKPITLPNKERLEIYPLDTTFTCDSSILSNVGHEHSATLL